MKYFIIAAVAAALTACAAPPAQPQPTPLVVYVTPAPTVVPTPDPTPRPTPKATPVPTPVADAGWYEFLNSTVDTLDRVTTSLTVFWDATAGSDEEWQAALKVWTVWGEAQTDYAGVIPAACYADLYAAWVDLVDQQYHLWDVATDAIIAGDIIDYDGLNDTSRIDAINAELDAVAC